MVMGVAFKFLQIVGVREMKKWRGIPQVRCTRKEIIRVEQIIVSC